MLHLSAMKKIFLLLALLATGTMTRAVTCSWVNIPASVDANQWYNVSASGSGWNWDFTITIYKNGDYFASNSADPQVTCVASGDSIDTSSSSYSVTAADDSDTAWLYATVEINAPPTIQTQPRSETVNIGGTAAF